MTEITLDVSELALVNRQLGAAFFELTNSGSRKAVMGEAGNLMRDMVQNRLHDKKYSPDGEPWKPWSPSYARSRKSGHSLLISSGDMARKVRRGRTGPRTTSAGSPAIYAAVHQFGHTFTNAFGKGITATVPARPYLGWGTEERDSVESVFVEWIERAVRWR